MVKTSQQTITAPPRKVRQQRKPRATIVNKLILSPILIPQQPLLTEACVEHALHYDELKALPEWLWSLRQHPLILRLSALRPVCTAGNSCRPAAYTMWELSVVAANLMARWQDMHHATSSNANADKTHRLFCVGTLLACIAQLPFAPVLERLLVGHHPWHRVGEHKFRDALLEHMAPQLAQLGLSPGLLQVWYTCWKGLLHSVVGMFTLADMLCSAWHDQGLTTGFTAVAGLVERVLQGMVRRNGHLECTMDCAAAASNLRRIHPSSACTHVLRDHLSSDVLTRVCGHLPAGPADCTPAKFVALTDFLCFPNLPENTSWTCMQHCRKSRLVERSWLACRDVVCVLPDGSEQPMDVVLSWYAG